MMTVKEAEMNREIIYNRYGHLLDRYLNAADMPDRKTEEYIRDVENGRYGHLLDNVTDPSQKIYDRMMKMCDMTLENKKRRAEEEECYEQYAREHIKNAVEKEKLHNERMRSFADGLIERKKAKIEAEAAEREKEEREARERQEYINGIQNLMDTVDKTKKISERADEIMLRRQKQEEEHKRQMAWFDSQKRG